MNLFRKMQDFFKKDIFRKPWVIVSLAIGAAVLIVAVVAIAANIATRDEAISQLEAERESTLSEIRSVDEEIAKLESEIATSSPEKRAELETKVSEKRAARAELNKKANNIEKQIREKTTPSESQPSTKPDSQESESTKPGTNDEPSQGESESEPEKPAEPSYIPVTSIVIDCPSEEVHPHTSIDLAATVYPTNATKQELSWSNSNPAVADLGSFAVGNWQSFNINGVGTAIITVNGADGATATCTLNSTHLPLTGFSIRPVSDRTVFDKGEQNLLYVDYEPTYATNRNMTWTTSDPSIATVEWLPTGYVVFRGQDWHVMSGAALVTFGDKEGRVEITATSEEGGFTKVIRYDNYQQ